MDELLFIGVIVLLVVSLAPLKSRGWNSRSRLPESSPSSVSWPQRQSPVPPVTEAPAAPPAAPPAPATPPAAVLKTPAPPDPAPIVRIHPSLTRTESVSRRPTPSGIIDGLPSLPPVAGAHTTPSPRLQCLPTVAPAEFPTPIPVLGRLWAIAPTWRHMGALGSRKPLPVEKPGFFTLKHASFLVSANASPDEGGLSFASPASPPSPTAGSFPEAPLPHALPMIEPRTVYDFIALPPEHPRPPALHQVPPERFRPDGERSAPEIRSDESAAPEFTGIETIFPGRRFPPPADSTAEPDWRFIGAPMSRAERFSAGWEARPFCFLGLPAQRPLPIRRSFQPAADREERDRIDFRLTFR